MTRDDQTILARFYRPKDLLGDTLLPVYLFFHGGGYLLGTIETEDAECSRVADNARMTVINVNYRHTPEFKHPSQVNDAWDSFEWLGRKASVIGGDRTQVIVGGISACAGLAASVVVQQHCLIRSGDSSRPDLNVCGLLLCISWLVHPDNKSFATARMSSSKIERQRGGASNASPPPVHRSDRREGAHRHVSQSRPAG